MKLKKYLRDIPTSILMIIGLAVSYFVLLNTADLFGKIKREQKSLDNFQYSSTIMVGMKETDDMNIKFSQDMVDNIMNYLTKIDSANIYFSDVNVFYNNEIDNYNCKIIIADNEPLKLYNVNNEEIKIPHSTNQSAILGKTLANHFKGNSKSASFNINNKTCNVIEVLKNNMSGNIDNSSYFVWKNCDPELKQILKKYIYEEICMGFLEITIKSDEPINAVYNDIVKTMNDKFDLTTENFKSRYKGDYQNYWYQFYNKIFTYTSLAFSILTCFIISEFWVLKRKKEFVIRKAFGYNNKQIFKLLMQDISKLSVFAILVAFILQLIYNSVFNLPFDIGTEFWKKTLLIVTGMLLIILLIIQHLIDQINKITVADGMRGE